MKLPLSYRAYKTPGDLWLSFNDVTISTSKIDQLSSNFMSGGNITIARYNDGEWLVGLQIPPYYEKRKSIRLKTTSVKDWYKIVDTSKILMKIIKSSPEYDISIDAFSMTDSAMQKHISPIVKNIKSVLGGGVFNVWSFHTGFIDLFNELNNRTVILVGPSDLKKLPFRIDHHIQTHLTLDITQPNLTVDRVIKTCGTIDSTKIAIIYSCSFTAKIAIDRLYSIYGNDITQLDMGSSLMPFIGLANRPWHSAMISEIKSLNLFS